MGGRLILTKLKPARLGHANCTVSNVLAVPRLVHLRGVSVNGSVDDLFGREGSLFY